MRTYSELIKRHTFEERFEYLKLNGRVGAETFGVDRLLNQLVYSGDYWKKEIRPAVIKRDLGRDLGVEGYELEGTVYIHHINPITVDDVLEQRDCIYDLNNLVLCSFNTHQAIHYSDKSILVTAPVERRKNDTCPWKK